MSRFLPRWSDTPWNCVHGSRGWALCPRCGLRIPPDELARRRVRDKTIVIACTCTEPT